MAKRKDRRPKRPRKAARDAWDEDEDEAPEDEDEELKGLMNMAKRTHKHMCEQGRGEEIPLLHKVDLPVPIWVATSMKDEVLLRYPTADDLEAAFEHAREKCRGASSEEIKLAIGKKLIRRLSGLSDQVVGSLHPLSLEALSEGVDFLSPSSPEQEEQ